MIGASEFGQGSIPLPEGDWQESSIDTRISIAAYNMALSLVELSELGWEAFPWDVTYSNDQVIGRKVVQIKPFESEAESSRALTIVVDDSNGRNHWPRVEIYSHIYELDETTGNQFDWIVDGGWHIGSDERMCELIEPELNRVYDPQSLTTTLLDYFINAASNLAEMEYQGNRAIMTQRMTEAVHSVVNLYYERTISDTFLIQMLEAMGVEDLELLGLASEYTSGIFPSAIAIRRSFSVEEGSMRILLAEGMVDLVECNVDQRLGRLDGIDEDTEEIEVVGRVASDYVSEDEVAARIKSIVNSIYPGETVPSEVLDYVVHEVVVSRDGHSLQSFRIVNGKYVRVDEQMTPLQRSVLILETLQRYRLPFLVLGND